MSRIYVNNLPKHATEDRIREFFSQKGEVTDAKIMHTPHGKNRLYGYVGFKTEHEANEALNYFNESYMDTSRITCEIALGVGDPNLPPPWSRYSSKKNELLKAEGGCNKRVTGKNGNHSKAERGSNKMDGDANQDPQLLEFLQVMGHRGRSKFWANDAVAAPSLGKLVANFDSSDCGIELQGKITSYVEEQDEITKGNDLSDDAMVSDAVYYKRKIRKEWSDSDDDVSGVSDKDASPGPVEGKHESLQSETFLAVDLPLGDIDSTDPSSAEDKESVILETDRLFISNLAYTCTEEELECYFSKYGAISHVHIVVERDTKRSKGFAYVRFSVPESAARAVEEADGSIFQGRLLHVSPAKQNIRGNNTTGKHSSQTLKGRKLEEKKASEASGNTKSWNSLYMHPDTVVENIARRLGVSKTELLDRESNDLAVRVALGEAQVVAETKRALSSAGINVASLEESAACKTGDLKRSNHVILVKNLPYNSCESDLLDMFGKFGTLEKIIFPPTRTLALVVFLEPADARAALGLKYKRYKDSVLYLEMAPDNILNQTPVNGGYTVVHEHDVERALLEQHMEEADVDHDRIEARSLYVKNLNFKTTDEAVKKHFTEQIKEGKILSVTVVKKKVKDGKNVSQGYGFVEFNSVDTAVEVLKELQGTVLDGHALILQRCRDKGDENSRKKAADGLSSTKIIVKNVAFETTKEDLRQLFYPFGQIKSLRLPRRLKNHSGFAFVEFITEQEAKNAMQSLSNTHLYGRHLVLERAKEGDGLEELRARTAAKFDRSMVEFSRKRKQLAVIDEGTSKFARKC